MYTLTNVYNMLVFMSISQGESRKSCILRPDQVELADHDVFYPQAKRRETATYSHICEWETPCKKFGMEFPFPNAKSILRVYFFGSIDLYLRATDATCHSQRADVLMRHSNQTWQETLDNNP